LVLAGTRQTEQLAQVRAVREKLTTMKRTYSRTKDVNLRERIARIAILVEDMQQAVRRNKTEETDAIRQSIDDLLR